MFNLKSLLSLPYGYYDYIWIDCIFIRETQKAILIEFDDRKIWLPKAWVVRLRDRRRDVRGDAASFNGQPIFIRTSQYNWAKNFS